MAEVIWTEPALDDLKNTVEYISRDSKVYAERFTTRVIEAARRLEHFPYWLTGNKSCSLLNSESYPCTF